MLRQSLALLVIGPPIIGFVYCIVTSFYIVELIWIGNGYNYSIAVLLLIK